MATLFSSEELSILKLPMGTLLLDDDVPGSIREHTINARMIISVGDATTDRLIALKIIPHIQIVDGRERRMKRSYAGSSYVKELLCVNPAGSISNDAIDRFKEALDSEKPVRIVVDGEEDLLTLVALAYAPSCSVILYGQPLEGMVVLRVDEESRSRYKELLRKIYRTRGDDEAVAV